MELTNELRCILKESLNWNKARLDCFVQMILALVTVRTINLTKLAVIFDSGAEMSSRYRRIQRFFSLFTPNYDAVAGLLFKLFFIAGEQWYLTVDRTNWKWGESDINVLMLGIVYRGVAIPVYWEVLDKQGNSDTPERIELIKCFIKQFGKDSIAGIFGDREFIGGEWFAWLLKENIAFYIRVKKNHLTTNSRGLEVEIKGLFYGLKPQEERILKGKRKLFGHDLYLVGLGLEDGELLILATSESPENAITLYALRWQIEMLFACLKSKGFNFEDTHIIARNRIKKILVLLSITFAWAHKIGDWRNDCIKKIKVKKHGRLAMSYFRYGLDYFTQAVVMRYSNSTLFKKCLELLSEPLNPTQPTTNYQLEQ
jgi:hypothetical protein